MFCSNCGKELPDVAKYCSACGETINYKQFNSCKNQVDTKKSTYLSFKNKKFITTVIILIFLFLFVLFAMKICSSKFKLKYGWGTHMNEVRNNEYVYEEFSPGEKFSQWSYYNSYVLVCEDPNHSVDRLEEFDISNDRKGTWDYLIFDKVTYEFLAENKKLFHIYYDFDGMSLGERLEIAKEHLGDDYFMYEYDDAWWKKGNTLIILNDDSIDYYDADYYIDMLESSEHNLSDNMEAVLKFIKS